ncbi:hypothetical protein DFH11DRAFT_987895 [Phellopilus nigrolimitatus]|nr:hypothetical protein DFH11DRAFT_987895 [Phellopilus nigrolimitatus]
MTITVEIHPSSSSVYMFNEPETSTAYSLSGHVSVSLSSSASFFEKARAEKVLLRSLKLTFEGHSELIMPETGYSASRLCSMTRELAPAQAMVLTNDGQEDNCIPCVWNFVFDIPVPGWLPSTSVFGGELYEPAGTRYALFAEARFTQLEVDHHARAWSISALCAPFFSKETVVRARRADIEVVRYLLPPVDAGNAEYPTAFPVTAYVLKMDHASNLNEKPGVLPHIPQEVLSKIELVALLPECFDVDDEHLLLNISMHAEDLPVSQRRRLRMTEFQVNLIQHEEYSRSPSRPYTSSFPLPPSQPDSRPLLNTHPMKVLYELGLVPCNSLATDASRLHCGFSLLSEKQRDRQKILNGGVSFAPETQSPWTDVSIRLSFEHFAAGKDKEWEERHGRVKALRADEESPHLLVYHELCVELTCTYDAEEEGSAFSEEHMVFSVPVRFARLPPVKSRRTTNVWPTLSHTSPFELSADAILTPDAPAMPTTSSYHDAFALPPYSQLFHSNGERIIDDSVPLPIYTPHQSPDFEAADKL